MEVRLPGRRPNAIGTLHVPADRPGAPADDQPRRIHSFYVPDFRIKQDVCPGRYTETWFEATKPGRYQIFCAEYCGTWHSQMWGEVVVMPAAEFDELDGRSSSAGLAARVDTGGDDGGNFPGDRGVRQAGRDGPGLPQVPLGRRPAAHRPDLGRPLQRRETLESGETIVADEAYLTDSMMDPRAKIVKGYAPVMPTYRGTAGGARGRRAGGVHQVVAQRRVSRTFPPRKRCMTQPAQPADTTLAALPGGELPERGSRREVVAADARPQAHRRDVPGVGADRVPLGGIFAMAVRLELLTPGPTIMGANTYNRMFTLHGVVMIFLFMIPAIPGVFGNFFLPLMLGAKDVAFPQLNLLSLYVYWIGALLALTGMVMGGTDTGWTFYAPYSTTTPMTVFPVLLGVFILGFSSILTGLNFIVTIHTLRAPGMTWMRMPLFVWAIYATSIIQVLATPVIGLTVMLVGIEQVGGFGLFDAAKGGDPVLFQHLFWFYSHPAVYIMVLPSMGVISDVDRRLLAQEHVRLQDDRLLVAGHRVRRLLRLGPPHVRLGPVALRQRRVRGHLDAGRRVHRHQGVQLGRHAVPGRDRRLARRSSTSAASCSSSCSAA